MPPPTHLTVSGKWGYVEHDWTATKGHFVYELPGESRTLRLRSRRADEGLRRHRLAWLDEQSNQVRAYDVHDYIAAARAHNASNGIGADYVDTLFR